MADDDLDPGDEAHTERFDRSDIDDVSKAIRLKDTSWADGQRITVGGMSWRPNLSKGNEHLHVHLADELMPYMVERLHATSADGSIPHLALPLEALFDGELALRLVEAEPRVHVIERTDKVADPEPLLIALGRRWRLSPLARTEVASKGWDLVQASGTAHEKGQRLEALLCFLLGQVADFEVSEHSLDTATEELDVVVTIRANSGRCWVADGSPFIVVEAKNWHTESVGQTDVSSFAFKISHKRNTVRIGLMVGTSGFSPQAKEQTLRTSTENLTIALLGPGEMTGWIEADDGDKVLEDLIRRAMLY